MPNIIKLDKLSFTFPVCPDFRMKVKSDIYDVSNSMINVIKKSKYIVTRTGIPKSTNNEKHKGLEHRYKYNILLAFKDSKKQIALSLEAFISLRKTQGHSYLGY